jgi:hypothetical protein
MSEVSPTYVPGVCNIGKSGVTFRQVVGWAGLVATLGLAAFLFVSKVDPVWRLMLFIPAFSSALGFLQARQRFCVNYGLMGLFKVGKDEGSVPDAESRRKDRATSLRIIGLALLIGIVVAVGAYFVPA